jgi:hypothetical protein
MAMIRLAQQITISSEKYELETDLPRTKPRVGKSIIGRSPVTPIGTAPLSHLSEQFVKRDSYNQEVKREGNKLQITYQTTMKEHKPKFLAI